MVRGFGMLRGAAAMLLTVFLFMLTEPLYADNTGKIAGRVRDKQTREALVGVNVVIKGTKLGAWTDDKGFFYVLKVPPGVYEVQFSLVGYAKVTVKNIRVLIDLTTEINVDMEEATIELSEVVIEAEHKLVQKDVTSTRRMVDRETISETPGLETASDIHRLQAGAYLSSIPPVLKLQDGVQLQVRDESLKDVHIRGGRGGGDSLFG